MKIRAAVFCLAAAACAVAQQVPKKIYRVETSDPKDIRMEVVHGETINLQWTFLSYANPLDIESAAVTLHARTNGMAEGVSFQVPGAAGPGGVATVRLAVSEWLPASVSEAEWTLEVVQPDAARILRAKGTVTATRSAAASTNDPVPVVWLDDIRAEIGAVQALGPRLDSIETEAADWRAAFAWGPHFAAGYLLPADLAPYATTQQVAVHTNRTDNPHNVTAPQIGALTNELDLAALRAYHYGSPDIVESPAEWFVFDGAGTITAFNWSAGRENVVIPWEIGGVPVSTIGANAFYDTDAYLGFPVTSVIAPQTVTVIGDSAFRSCGSLTSVSLPQATAIGDFAFYGCGTLDSVSLPQATAIGGYAFRSCGSLPSVSLPQAQTVGDGVFSDCFLLASINLPQAQTVGIRAFDYCYSLTSVSLPQATSIGDRAFSHCTTLAAVRMGQNAPAEATSVFASITPPPTVYVTNPQATGWGAVWNGVPVVRPPLYGDEIYRAGQPVATEAHVAQAIAGKVDQDSGMATNLWLQGETIVSDSYTNLWWRNVYSNGWHWLVAYTNAPGGAQ